MKPAALILCSAALTLTACGTPDEPEEPTSSTPAPSSSTSGPDYAADLDCSAVTEADIKEWTGSPGTTGPSDLGGCRIVRDKDDDIVIKARWEILPEGQTVDGYLEEAPMSSYKDLATTGDLADGTKTTVIPVDGQNVSYVYLLAPIDEGFILNVETEATTSELSPKELRTMSEEIAETYIPWATAG